MHDMMQFFSFGSGSCGNCYYLSNGEDAVLIDAGVGMRRLKRDVFTYGVQMQFLKGLLITHDHADHIKSAGYLSSGLKLRVYTTQKIHEGMLHNYHTTKKVEAEWNVNVEKDETFQIGKLCITPFDIPHDSTENVGYEIRNGAEGEIFCIMTDVGMPTEAVCEHVRRSNYLVIEANYDPDMLSMGAYPAYLKKRITSGRGHMSNVQTADVLAENFHENLRNVWLCHLSEENNHPELARKTVEMKLRERGIVTGKDFQLDVLKRGVSMGPWELHR